MPHAGQFIDATISIKARAARLSILFGITVWVLGLLVAAALYAVERFQLIVLFYLAAAVGLFFVMISLPCAAIVGIYKALKGISAKHSTIGLALNASALFACWWITWVWIFPRLGGSHG